MSNIQRNCNGYVAATALSGASNSVVHAIRNKTNNQTAETTTADAANNLAILTNKYEYKYSTGDKYYKYKKENITHATDSDQVKHFYTSADGEVTLTTQNNTSSNNSNTMINNTKASKVNGKAANSADNKLSANNSNIPFSHKNKTDTEIKEMSNARRSGSKRDHDTSMKTDQNPSASNAATGSSGAPRKKVKVTYKLPHQNMEEGHFYVVLGEDIDVSTQRFKILSLLGEGTFGKVVEAWDRKRKEYCAVKIVRNVPKYTRDAKIEIQFMEKVRQADPYDHFSIMKIQRYFQNDTSHMCIVMPKYGPCLLDWIMKHGPFTHRQLAEIIFHCGTALDFFHSDLHLMHTDLKPENILMESAETIIDPIHNRVAPVEPLRVRLCDLGGCCDERHSRTAIVSTRHYRSPEVILGLGWMYSTDMWSMGCIIYELYTGKLLYDTHDDLEHLHLMEKTLGRLPGDWAARCGTEAARALYSSSGQLRHCTDPKHLARIQRATRIHEVIRDEHLLDLISGLLNYDRQRRYNARQMSTHPYVQKYYPECKVHPNYPDNRQLLRPCPIA